MLMDKRNESATIGNRDDELLSRVRLREPDHFDVDQPGRFAQGPEEKHGLAGRRVGFIKLFLARTNTPPN